MRRWWRQFWRKRTNPVPRSHAEKMKHKLSVFYAFCGYNILGIALILLTEQYYPMTDKEKRQPGRYYARLYQEDVTTVYKIDGLSVVDSYPVEKVPDLIPEEFRKKKKKPQTDEVKPVEELDKELLTG